MDADLELAVAYGVGTPDELRKADSGSLNWARNLRTRYLLNGRVCWQPYSHLLRNFDMVVVTQENKLVCNFWTQYFDKSVRVGLWGHGANLQGSADNWREKLKKVASRRADWWFAYTELSVPLIQNTGFPGDRISVLNNSVDTSSFAEVARSFTLAERANLTASLRIIGSDTGIYIGSLYEEKRIDFLLAAAEEIRRRVPTFEMLIVGAGPQKHLVEAACEGRNWLKYLGPKTGREKMVLLLLSKVMLNPGLVGLGIIDSFVGGVPMATTDCGLHSPEIAYLENGVNGIMTPNDLHRYVDAVVRVITDKEIRESLVRGCRISADKYSLENMARNFTDGVISCLSRAPHR